MGDWVAVLTSVVIDDQSQLNECCCIQLVYFHDFSDFQGCSTKMFIEVQILHLKS